MYVLVLKTKRDDDIIELILIPPLLCGVLGMPVIVDPVLYLEGSMFFDSVVNIQLKERKSLILFLVYF